MNPFLLGLLTSLLSGAMGALIGFWIGQDSALRRMEKSLERAQSDAEDQAALIEEHYLDYRARMEGKHCEPDGALEPKED